MCHYRHRAHDDPFAWPGLTDITAHVDFTAMAEAGERAGLAGCGLHRAGAVPAGLRDSRRAGGDRRARVARLHPGGGGGAEAARALRDGGAVQGAGAGKIGGDRLAGVRRRRSPAPAVTIRASANHSRSRHGNADRHRQPRHGLAARAPRALPAAPHGGRHRVARAGRARDPAQLARVRRLRQPLRERAGRRSASPAATASRPCSRIRSSSLATYWACAKLGAVVVPLSPLLTATGLASLVADASPRVIIGSGDQLRDAGRSARPDAGRCRAGVGAAATPRPTTKRPATGPTAR